MFRPERLKIARERRGLTQKSLADLAGISTRTLSTFENATFPNIMKNDFFEKVNVDSETLLKISKVLDYPVEYFFSTEISIIDQSGISFRAMTKLSAAKKNAAIGAASLALEIDNWIESRFNLPKVDLLGFDGDSFADAETAARDLREYWHLGELSISNMIHLLESKGIRVFSLAENCLEVDAYSFWLDDKPFIFLNTMKSPERSRFDAAHELAHLVLHKHSSNSGRRAEEQADKFASAFLMPKSAILSRIPYTPTLDQLIELKKLWKISLTALVRRTFDLGLSSEWHYRQLNIDLSRKGFHKNEPEGMTSRETSLVIEKISQKIKEKGIKRSQVLKELKLPSDEVSNLTFNNLLFDIKVISGKKMSETDKHITRKQKNSHLKIVG